MPDLSTDLQSTDPDSGGNLTSLLQLGPGDNAPLLNSLWGVTNPPTVPAPPTGQAPADAAPASINPPVTIDPSQTNLPKPDLGFAPLEPENPDSQSASKLIESYNRFRAAGGKTEDLSYDELNGIASVAKGLSNQTTEMQLLTNPKLYYEQVYKAGKAPEMVDDVVTQAAKNPESIPGLLLQGTDWAAHQVAQLGSATAHGVGDVIKDYWTSLNPWSNKDDRDAAMARNANGIFSAVKTGVTLLPNLVAGLKETVQYDDLKAKLATVTDPAQRDQIEHQISEILRLGQLRATQNDQSVKTAYKDVQGFLNSTGIYAALHGKGMADGIKILGTDQAQPTANQAQVLDMIYGPSNWVPGLLGEASGAIKSSVRMGAYEDAVSSLNKIDQNVSAIAASRTATEAAIASATDNGVKQSLQQDLAKISAQEGQIAPVRAAALDKVTTLGASVTKQINDLTPSLTQRLGGGAIKALGAGVDAVAGLVENASKVPDWMAEKILGTEAPIELKSKVTDVLSGMMHDGLGLAGVSGALAHGIAPGIGYYGAKIAEPLIKMLANPEAMRSLARDAKVIGEQFALGKETLPALQAISEKTSGLTSGLASFLDNPLVRSIPSVTEGAVKGGLSGGLLGATQTGGTLAGAAAGAIPGAVLGAAGAGHGQMRTYNSAEDLRGAAIGDRKRFIDTLDPKGKGFFNQLTPDTQLALGVYGHAHPDLRVSFINDPKNPQGIHYVTGDGAQAVINIAAKNPLDSVLQHEIGHHIASHGFGDMVADGILGNPATGQIGAFTHLDANGKPVITSATDPTGVTREAYMPSQQFLQYKNNYNTRKLRDLPDSNPEDNYGIAQEMFAEMHSSLFSNREQVQKLLRGTVPSDLVNTSALSNFFSKLGLPFDAQTGSLNAHPDQIAAIQGLSNIVTEYIKGRQFKNHPLESEDGYSRVVPDAWRSDPSILTRNLDGAGILTRNPKTGNVVVGADGLPIIKSEAQADKDHAQFTQSVVNILKANPNLLGKEGDNVLKLVSDRNGRKVYRGQIIPGEIFDQLSATNQFNPYQIANWRTLEGITRRDDGSVTLANYNTAKGRGGKYATVEMKERALVPLWHEISPITNQVNIQAYDPAQMMKNIASMLKRKDAKGVWGSAADALDDVHTYLENLAANRPGETGIGLQKKQLINSLFGKHGDANPYVETLAREVPSVFKTFRLDRANKVREIVGVKRPVYGGTYEKVRSFLLPQPAPTAETLSPTVSKVSDILPDHPAFDKHPWIKNLDVEIDPKMDSMGQFVQGTSRENPVDSFIRLRDPSYRDTLAHEVTHAAQFAEGREFGGSSITSWTGSKRAGTLALARDIYKRMITPLSEDEFNRQAGPWDSDEQFNKAFKDYKAYHRSKDNQAKMWRLAQEAAGQQAYRNLPSEIEARGGS